MGYAVTLLTVISVYTMLTAAMDLVLGYAGMFSFAQAALYGVGAYTGALVALKFGLGLDVALLAAIVVTAAVSWVTASITVRLEGDYFILGTFCVANVVSSVMDNWTDVTNGANGLYGVPMAKIFGIAIVPGLPFLGFCAALAAISLMVKSRLVSAPFGIALQAVRDDEIVASVLGNDVKRLKIIAFVIGGALTAVGGTLLAFFLRFLDPTTFTFAFTILIWAALFVGGSVGTLGTIVGPALLVLFPEALRFVGLEGTHVAAIQQALYGLLLVVLMLYRPQGFFGRHVLR